MIHIVGAGPGDPELLTIRAKRIIDSADVILFADSLVNQDILIDSKAKVIIRTSDLNIDEINGMVYDYYMKGMDIARIHSGDPAIYGAINDEISFYKKNNLDFDIVPGIPSLFAASAKIGIELTSPGTTQTIIITRVPRRTEIFENEDLSMLAAHKTSIAIFLSASNSKNVVKKLLKAGYSENDSAIIAYKISWPDEKIILTTIGNIEKSLFENRINRQALILVGGNVSAYSDKKSFLYSPDFTHLFRKSTK